MTTIAEPAGDYRLIQLVVTRLVVRLSWEGVVGKRRRLLMSISRSQ
jgi:hypothetical protein